jgi:hypothetical protein
VSEAQAEFIASVEVLALWVTIAAFMITYALGSPGWRDRIVGRVIMNMAASMWVLCTLALTGRWFPFADDVFQYLALGTYALILLSWAWLLFVTILIQRGVITPTRLDPHPVRDWWRRRRAERHPR